MRAIGADGEKTVLGLHLQSELRQPFLIPSGISAKRDWYVVMLEKRRQIAGLAAQDLADGA